MKQMRIGIFGGSFDPIHVGHLILAEQCREHARLDEVWFIPTSTSPLKQKGAAANDRQRMEMIEMAIAGHPSFLVSNMELKRGGVSYTVDTLRSIKDEHPNDELFLLMGGDSPGSFSQWKEPAAICEMAIPLVVARPGSDPVDLNVFSPFVKPDRLAEIERYAFQSRQIDISSTELRTRIANGMSIRYLTARAVQKFIESKQLYDASEED